MTKHFVPLECNPEVFDELIHSLGVTTALSFHDVYVIDDPDMLAMIPRPVYALLLVFPVSDTYEEYRHDSDKDLADDYYNSVSGTDKEQAVWFKQTIGNACGTMALLHALANGIPAGMIEPGSTIDILIKESIPLNTVERVKLLENSTELEQQHAKVGIKGDTAAPDAEASVEFHYVCLTRARNSDHLVELDGRRKGPIDLGPLSPDSDLLSEPALNKVREFLARESASSAFSIIALAPSFS
ncbi:Yuh1p [Sugiyamaella lignohabitans]|uniref:Ubiquitin carboxyl-terminal hydrolase n=1 Tax=Sugiyamaella lignohabitans TaxID=796027 RepID=A0A161HME6_9ASCO|nr:Yuh1p [Sugiyamaella lignohabitans]ANB14857.1 Yuh1p [Sugiyamaella lignohabitans]